MLLQVASFRVPIMRTTRPSILSPSKRMLRSSLSPVLMPMSGHINPFHQAARVRWLLLCRSMQQRLVLYCSTSCRGAWACMQVFHSASTPTSSCSLPTCSSLREPRPCFNYVLIRGCFEPIRFIIYYCTYTRECLCIFSCCLHHYFLGHPLLGTPQLASGSLFLFSARLAR